MIDIKNILAALTSHSNIGGSKYHKIKNRCDEIQMSIEDFYFAKDNIIKKEFGDTLKGKTLENFLINRNEIYFKAKNELNILKNNNIQILTIENEKYPVKLKEIMKNQAPPVLYTYGNIELAKSYSTSIIGTRNPSNIGLLCAKNVSCETLKNNNVITSGYAKGIDYTAHYTALSKGGKTILVLPYPIIKFNNRLFNELQNQGFTKDDVENKFLIISEFLTISPISPRSMPIIRNRTVSALSDEVYVIEADKPSGTLNTALCSMKFGNEVYVIDYSELKTNPAGNEYLINNNARDISILNYYKGDFKKNII